LTGGGKCLLEKVGGKVKKIENWGKYFWCKFPKNARHRIRQFCIQHPNGGLSSASEASSLVDPTFKAVFKGEGLARLTAPRNF